MKHLFVSLFALSALSLSACSQDPQSNVTAQGYEPASPLHYSSTGASDTKVVYLDAIGTYLCGGGDSPHTTRFEIAVEPNGTVVATLYPSSGGPASHTDSLTYDLFTGALRTDIDPQLEGLPTETEIYQAHVPAYAEQYKKLFDRVKSGVSSCVEGQHGIAGPQELAPLASYLEGVQL